MPGNVAISEQRRNLGLWSLHSSSVLTNTILSLKPLRKMLSTMSCVFPVLVHAHTICSSQYQESDCISRTQFIKMDQMYNPFGFLLPGFYLSLPGASNVSGYMSARRNWGEIGLQLSLVPLPSSITVRWGCFPVLLPIMLLFLLSILDCLPPCPVYELPLTQHLTPRLSLCFCL